MSTDVKLNAEGVSDERLEEIRDGLDNGMAARMMATELLAYRRAASDGDVVDVVKRMRLFVDDPMWADHAEVPKLLCASAADLIVSLKSRLAKSEQDGGNIAERLLAAAEDYDDMLARAEAAEARLATIERETIERCAKVAEAEGVSPELNVWGGGPEWYKHGQRIATAIRALKSSIMTIDVRDKCTTM